MTTINSAYQTTPCKDYVMRKIEGDLKDALVTGRLVSLRENIWVVPTADYDAAVGVIGVFNYPVILQHNGENHAVIDGRMLLSMQPNGEMHARRYDEMLAKVILAQLALEWANDEQMRLLSFNALPLGVFANWLSEVIGKRFSLNMAAQMNVGILAAIYYHNLFGEGAAITEQNAAESIVAISRACGYRPSDIKGVVEAYPRIESLDDFCSACRDFTQDVHLRDLNPVTLSGVVGGYWYGNAGRESIAVALEYPPLWITLLLQAVTDRSFKKAGLTAVVERNTWRRHIEGFVRALMPRSEINSAVAIKL